VSFSKYDLPMSSSGFLWMLCAAVVAGVIYTLIMAFRYPGSEAWPATDGLIENMIEIRTVGNHGPYYGVLSYSYEVADEYYSGEWSTPTFRKRSEVSEFVEKRIPKGTKVTVKYDPAHPDRSVLELDISVTDPTAPITFGIS
jgi:Protein of unknown function (DUF3592)